jgi:hypothetical protein
MAVEVQGFKLGILVAGADLTTHQYKLVKVNSSGKVVLAGLGEAILGVLQNAPNTDQAAEVQVDGVSKAVASGVIAAGDLLASDAAAKLKVAVKGRTDTSDAGAATDPLIGSHVIGVALEAAAADGNRITILLQHMGAVPTTLA